MTCQYNDFLTATGFALTIEGESGITAAVQSFTHPTVSTQNAIQSSPRRDIPVPGDKLVYDALNVVIILNADMGSYKAVYDWLESCVENVDGNEKDVHLHIMSSTNNAGPVITYENAFPIDVGAISFATTDQGDSYITVDATFAYTRYQIS